MTTTERWDALWINAHLATMAPGGAPYGAIADGALAVKGGRIAWVGPRRDLPGAAERAARRVHDAGGRWITPGLIDCHTHLVFAGDRSGEFERRLEGASYEDIARRGGGIRATVAATRAADEESLLAASAARLRRLMADGVTTVEIKSGYGLDTEAEIKCLRVARRLGAEFDVGVAATCLAAHALPPEYDGRRAAYLDLVCEEILPLAAKSGLADAVDAFCETIAFTPAETARVFEAARALGLPVKLHADQLSDQGGAALAARFGALSADHLEHAAEDGIAAMAESGTVAVLLPGAFYTLGGGTPGAGRPPPVAAFRARGVPMAVASDCNPGSSPVLSLLAVLNMACTLFRLRPEEALAGATREAARALGLGDRLGTLAPGKEADFVLWDVERPAALCYWLGASPCAVTVKGGRVRHDPPGAAPASPRGG